MFRTVLYGYEEGWEVYKRRLNGIIMRIALKRKQGKELEGWE